MKSENIIEADFGVGEPPAPPKKWQRVRVNKKLLFVAFVVEAVIIGAVLFAGYQFAERFSGGNKTAWWMAMVGAIAYAAVEMARVPLAITAATHRQRFVRFLAFLTLLGAVYVTTKSLSQVGEQMYSYRLVEVRQAQTALEVVQANNGGAVEDDADKRERIKALDGEIEKLLEGLKQFGPPPKPAPVYGIDRKTGKRIIVRWVTPAWAGAEMQKQLVDARAKRNAMDGETKETAEARDAAKAAIAKAQGDYDVAVMNSQLHSFAAMIMRKAPSKVTDDEIAIIMLLFVFIGAFAGAVTATGLAYCCFTRYPAMDEPDFTKAKRATQTVEIIPALRVLAKDLKLKEAA